MKLLVVGDVHIADSAPAKRTDTYLEDIKDKLAEILEISIKQGADAVLFHGDIFHHKHPHRTTHRTVNWLCRYFEAFHCHVYIVVGNHDISDYQLESLVKQPLGVIGHLENVTLLEWDSVSFNGGDIVLSPIPGVSNITTDAYAIPKPEGAKWHILAAHQSIIPDMSKLPEFLQDKPFMHDSNIVAAVTDADVVLYGHEHGNHGVYQRNGKLFVNLGSICRGTIGEGDLNKEPAVFLLNLGEKLSGGIIKLKNVKPASEVFLLEEHFAAKDHRADIEDAISRLNDTRLEKFSIETIMVEIGNRDDIDAGEREAALDLLETVK